MKELVHHSVFAAAVFGLIGGCSPGADESGSETDTRTYQATGTVMNLLPDGRHVRIHHAEIPGFMHEMTMSFAVKDSALFGEVEAGDSIRFTLDVSSEEIVVISMARIEDR